MKLYNKEQIMNILNKESIHIDYIKKYIIDNNIKEIVFVCIGTDRCTGDSLGPLVGQLITDCYLSKYKNIYVYGTLKNTINALNVDEEFKKIKNKHKNALIIGIDASLTTDDKDLNTVILAKKPIYPGKGFDKDIQTEVGTFSIKGIVGDSNIGYEGLKVIKLHNIYKLSIIIISIIVYFAKWFSNLHWVKKDSNVINIKDKIKQEG